MQLSKELMNKLNDELWNNKKKRKEKQSICTIIVYVYVLQLS